MMIETLEPQLVTSARSLNPFPASHGRVFHRFGSLAVVLIGAGLMLAACGRKGAPEYDTGEPVVKSDTNQLVPGLQLPQKSSTTEKPKQPKGNFVLDPLL